MQGWAGGASKGVKVGKVKIGLNGSWYYLGEKNKKIKKVCEFGVCAYNRKSDISEKPQVVFGGNIRIRCPASVR